MNILPIDFDLSDYELSKWHDKWSVEKFGEGVLDPCRYYQVSKDGLYLYTDSVAEGEALNEEKAIRDYVLELLVRIRAINRKLKGVGINKHLTYQEREELKKRREALYNEIKGLNSRQTTDAQSLNPEPQQMELKDLLPNKLKADEAVEVFQNAIDAQLITNSPEGLKWNDTKQLLAYFATKVSDKFNLTTKLDKDGNKTTDWKTFETLFEQKGLKGAKQNWMRLNTKFEPTGFEKVEPCFRASTYPTHPTTPI